MYGCKTALTEFRNKKIMMSTPKSYDVKYLLSTCDLSVASCVCIYVYQQFFTRCIHFYFVYPYARH